ncbi:hypothetical protein BDW59DRAFT_56972 [Aspergillus cavernicola]|uniref:Integral membrane protein n=1 Tax=Aspergillus cavernicola TaxID=176166 RepID=A0ABR4IKQ0_9EURO
MNQASTPPEELPRPQDVEAQANQRDIPTAPSDQAQKSHTKPTESNIASVLAVWIAVFVGVYGFIALYATTIGNEQSQIANQIALLSFCASTAHDTNSNLSTKPCRLLLAEPEVVSKLADKLYRLPSSPDDGAVSLKPSSYGRPDITTYSTVSFTILLAGLLGCLVIIYPSLIWKLLSYMDIFVMELVRIR